MSSAAILAVYLACAAAELVWQTLLTLLNMGHARRHAGAVPAFFRELWAGRRAEPPEETYARSVRYTLARNRLALLAKVVSTLVVVAIVSSGSLGWLERALAAAIPVPPLVGLAFVLSVGLLLQILGVPFGLYAQFVIEKRFGFNTMTVRLWLLDRLKGLAVSAALFVPLLLLLFWLMDRAGASWWLFAAGVVIVFQLLLTVIYPAVISPLFNKFSPLEEGSLRRRVLELARKLGFGVRGIFVMDASRRSRHSSAYFTGLGSSRRIVLYDTLLKRLGEEETLAVLAHEIGHEKLGHIRKLLGLGALATVAGFWVASLLLVWTPFFQAFGLAAPSYHAAVVILAFCAGPFTFAFEPLQSLWSRRYEYAADRFSQRAMGTSAPLVSALFSVHADNLSNLMPHPLYSFTHYSHPTLSERVRALRAADQGQ